MLKKSNRQLVQITINQQLRENKKVNGVSSNAVQLTLPIPQRVNISAVTLPTPPTPTTAML